MIHSVTQTKWLIPDSSEYADKLTGSHCFLRHSRAHGQGVQEISHKRQPTTTSKIGRDHRAGARLVSCFLLCT